MLTSLGMVLFFCTLTAMKRQDEAPIAQGMEDFFQPGEKEEYGGCVMSTLSLSYGHCSDIVQ